MRKQLMLLLMLTAFLNYRPSCAQAGAGDSPTVVASVRTKPVAARLATDMPTAKATVTTKKEATKKSKNSVSRLWSRIMGYCNEVHTASRKKS